MKTTLIKKLFFKKNNNCLKPYYFLLFFFISIVSNSQTTVNSLTALLPYLDDDNANVKLASGTYSITTDDINIFDEKITILGITNAALLHFSGNNSTYDFTGVTINFDTGLFKAYGAIQVYEVHITGSNNVIKNLTMVDDGTVYDNPTKGACNIVMDGAGNRVEGFHVTIKGSWPYGYGDAFGKGGTNNVILHYKHSACLVRGESNHVKGSTFIHRSYGHCIFMQAANNPIIEGCTVEGEVRSTDEMLAEAGTGTRADDVNFMTTWGYKLPAGYMMSLGEEGIRAYNGGQTVINGVEYERGTSNPTVIDCTIKNMRGGVTLAHASGDKYVEGTTAIGCEGGFQIGTGTIVDCYADAAYGPVYKSTYGSDKNLNAEITIIAPESGYYNGANSLAYLGGNNHNITLRNGDTDINDDLKIEMGGDHIDIRLLDGSNSSQNNHISTAVELENYTGYPIVISASSDNNTITTCGSVSNNGSSNSIVYSNDCNVTTGCTSYASNTSISGLISGINYKYYEGIWDALPNFDELTPTSSGITTAINLSEAQDADYYGLTFEGYINITNDSQYTFYTTSDDGSSLWIDGEQVVDNDGLHGAQEASGLTCLKAGYHLIKVAFFEKSGGNTLSVSYQETGGSKTTLSSFFVKDESITSFVPDPNKTYYIEAPIHKLRLGATGESEDAFTTTNTMTGDNVEWKFVAKGNGYWHIQRAAGGTKPRLRTDLSENADMQATSSSGSWTYYDITEGSIENTYFLTLPDATTNISRLQIDNTGAVKMVENTRNGTWESFTITEVETPASFSIIEAEDYNTMYGIQTEISSENEENVGWINDGDWLQFNNIDLTGAKSVALRVASKFSGGTIEIRSGSVSGVLLGSAIVTNTGGNQSWVTLNTSIESSIGEQDIYLVFTDGTGYLFNLNWLEFSATSTSGKSSIDELNDMKISIYPNYVDQLTTISLKDKKNLNSTINICLYNLSGTKLSEFNTPNTSYTLDMSNYASGLYLVKVNDGYKEATKRIIKK